MRVAKKDIERFVEFNLKLVEIRGRPVGAKPIESFVSALVRHLPPRSVPKARARKATRSQKRPVKNIRTRKSR